MIYLFERQNDGEGSRKGNSKEKSSICRTTPQIATKPGLCQGPNSGARNAILESHVVNGSQALVPPSDAFLGTLAESRIGNGATETRTGTL